MFVGGCTMAEVAALRFLSQQVTYFSPCPFFYLTLGVSTVLFVGHNTRAILILTKFGILISAWFQIVPFGL